jgi:hypothetical protein
VTALALLRFLGRGADRLGEWRISGQGRRRLQSRPRHLVSVDQLASRRRTVDGRMRPDGFQETPAREGFRSTSAGMP